MNVGTLYQDSMDQSRTLRPVSPDGTCNVYFDGVCCGKAKVPTNLFSLPTWQAERYGMVLWSPPVERTRDDEDDREDRR